MEEEATSRGAELLGPVLVDGVDSSPATSAGAATTPNTDGVHVFNEQTNYVPRSTIITVFLACASVDLLALMDQTTLAASLYIIADDLKASDQASWIASGYFITSTIGQLLYGRLSDIWSRKVILLIGLAIFFFGSLAASLSQTIVQLIIFRCFTGIGGGGLMTVAQLIVSDIVPLRERGKYQGILGSVVALANGIGPVVGGILSSKSADSWRWIFRLNLPLTVLTTSFVVFFMPLKKVEGDWKLKFKAIDFIGVVLTLAGVPVFMLGLTWGGSEYPWNSSAVIATLVVGFFLCVVFVLWQWKGPKYPLVPLHIFKSMVVNGACITMAINGWNFVVQIYYIPTFYQLAYGYSATKAGAMLLPITLIQTLSSTLSGLVVHWIGRYRECILFGWLCWAVGLGLMSTLDEHSGVGKQIGFAIITGVGVGNTLQPSLIAIQAGVSRWDMAVVTSFRNFVRNLGGTFGLAICGTLLNNIISQSTSSLQLDDASSKALLSNPQSFLSSLSVEEAGHVRSVLIPAYRQAFRVIFLVGASLAAFAFFIAFFMIPQVELRRPDDEKLKDQGLQAHLKKKEQPEDA
ncbi:major facilitator superfamily domain-containing protein [Pseudomassariella vexata]|uniref:Major facilitator superfamily domain-containing protein n=1 Tax=Pseudomassariella vexata TaxID=1141098 RepID=A0A1Y2DQE7_9PEZI|nr:major facilitator superfamily domain-containing protein [Pseudomassariella vexata]ORY61523.1 major facilitator superfamily domain-containing protein [Pseudomassariella vexata]